jgi:CheY-like chemotaxis protein
VARVRLIHWNGPEGRERRLFLTSLGHEAVYDDLDGPALGRRLRADCPDAFVIDLSRLPSHGREVAMALRTLKSTRSVPIVFVDGDPQKVARLKALLPDATYTTWGRLKAALPRAIAHAPVAPIVPPSSIYSGKPAVEKIGVKERMQVCLLGAPPRFAETLTPLPAKVKFSAKAERTADLFLCFVRSARELAAHFASLAPVADRQTLWMIWRKKASGVKSDLNGNVVRETGLAAGWVDFKICSIDDTWSGLAFKRRR